MGPNELLGEQVTTRYADGSERSHGKVVAYCAEPTVIIEREDGTRESWRADMLTLDRT